MLPAYIGVESCKTIPGFSTAHNEFRGRDRKYMYDKYFSYLTDVPLDALLKPDKYPEFYI